MSFEKAFAHVIEAEGGYSNDEHDSGGPTNLGITQADLSNFIGRQATIADVKALTIETVRPIYRQKYWQPMGLDLIEKEEDQLIIFSQGVNRGIRTIQMQAQEVLRQNFGKKLSIDGRIGSVTAGLLNGLPEDVFAREFLQSEVLAYDDICIRNNTQLKFLKGWHNRVAALQDICWNLNEPGRLVLVPKPEEAPLPEDAPTGKKSILAPYEWALKEKGQSEIPGSKHNPRIVYYHSFTSFNGKTDEVPWCASFICAALANTGFLNPRRADAIYFRNYGLPGVGNVGEIAAITHPSGGNHVAFLNKPYKKGDKYIELYGGNQNNQAKVSVYNASELRALRIPVPAKAA